MYTNRQLFLELLNLERRRKFMDDALDKSPDSLSRRTSRYVIALREHLEILNLRGIGIDVDVQKDGAKIVALTYGNKQYLCEKTVKVDVKMKPKLAGETLLAHESGKLNIMFAVPSVLIYIVNRSLPSTTGRPS